MIIGITGSLGAGKGAVSEYLEKQGFFYTSTSDELRELAREEGIELTRENLQNLGDKIRKENGVGYLAERLIEKIRKKEFKKAIVDSIRNPGEVEVLRKFKNFSLVAIDAPPEIRFERLKARNREKDPKNWEDFVKIDNRDKGIGEDESGQAVNKCIQKADYILLNDGDLESTHRKLEFLYEEIEKNLQRPSWDEYFLEITRAVAKRATCNRGRCGSVIAKDKQILVTGYVGSPVGLPHCDEVGHQMKTVTHEDGSQSQHCVRTTHAEQNAICQAAKLGIPVKDATLYSKMTPCAVCAKLIINSGISRVVCEKKYHAGRESEEAFLHAGIPIEFLNEELEIYKNQ